MALRSWQLQEAKNKLSEVVRRAKTEGPQVITVRGEDEVVVISVAEYERRGRGRTGRRLAEAILDPGVRGLDLRIEPLPSDLPDPELSA